MDINSALGSKAPNLGRLSTDLKEVLWLWLTSYTPGEIEGTVYCVLKNFIARLEIMLILRNTNIQEDNYIEFIQCWIYFIDYIGKYLYNYITNIFTLVEKSHKFWDHQGTIKK